MKRLAVLLTMALAACQTVESPKPAVIPVALPARAEAVTVKDESLKAKVGKAIAQLGPAYRAVSVETWGGRALLMGAVIKPEQRRKAEQAARAEGAAEVLNELVLAEDKLLDSFRDDPARADALRRHIGLDGGAAVRVVNGVAFLLGTAPPDQAAALKAEASDVEGIKWVVAHFAAP